MFALARREGWIARRCSRGGAFDVIELWLENRFLLELPTAEMQRAHLDFMTPARFRTLFDL